MSNLAFVVLGIGFGCAMHTGYFYWVC